MKKYSNSKGNSGVKAFEINPKSIVVQFVSGEIYTYPILLREKFI